MVAVIITAVILFLVALLRIGITVVYSEDGLNVLANIGPVCISLFPASKGKNNSKKTGKIKSSKKNKSGKDTEDTPKKGGNLQRYFDIINAVAESLTRLRKRILVNDLTILYTVSGNDPVKTAINFGYVNSAIGVIMPPLENIFRIRNCNVSTNVDFISNEPYVYLRLKLSLAFWELIYIAAGTNFKKVRELI